jgi:dihydrofolate reductase
MIVSIIAAIGKNRELGYKNQLLWHIPEDLKRFRRLTQGHVVVMGRKTYESIGKPLPKRINIVVSRNLENAGSKDVVVASSLEEALRQAKALEKRGEVFVIGGGQIYNQALKYTDRLYLTKVNKEAKADTYFPEYEHIFIKTVNIERGAFSGNSFEYLTLEKAK